MDTKKIEKLRNYIRGLWNTKQDGGILTEKERLGDCFRIMVNEGCMVKHHSDLDVPYYYQIIDSDGDLIDDNVGKNRGEKILERYAMRMARKEGLPLAEVNISKRIEGYDGPRSVGYSETWEVPK